MNRLLSTREVAQFLGINEKKVYTLVAEKGLPASKVTGKWLFPQHLVEQWVEMHTINYPEPVGELPSYQGLLVIAGSNDPLLDRTISLFNTRYPDHVAVFGNLGSMGGLRALRRNICHMASSHLLQENESEYNFDFAGEELERMPAVVNFCRREQGLLLPKGNPKRISGIEDFDQRGLKMVNRPVGTGTRLLMDHELNKKGIQADRIEGYHREVSRHLDVGLEIISGRADVGPAIRAVAGVLDLDFIPLRWERYDLMVSKDRFFDKGVQFFLGLLVEEDFKKLAAEFSGYDATLSGKVIYPQEKHTHP